MKTVSEYLRYAEGRKIDTDGVPKQPYQCADLIKDYMRQCWGLSFSFTLPDLNPYGYAKSIYENFNSYPQLKGKFSRIKNTPSFVPQKGDIVVWGEYEGITGKEGHIAIALGGEYNTGTSRFVSLDQNWHKKYYVCKAEHNYRGVLGVIRPLQKVTAVDVNIRRGPGVTFKKIGDKEKGEVVRPLTYKNGWAQIAEGQWICAKYLD